MKQYKVEHFELMDGKIEVVLRYPSNQMYACNPPKPVPDTVIKRIYGVIDGQIKLIEEKEGKHIPAQTNIEQIIFE